MADLRSECGVVVAKALNIFIKNKGFDVPEVEASSLLLETPPNPEMGDVGIPLFAFAKTLRMGPPVIASELVKIIEADLAEEAAKVGLEIVPFTGGFFVTVPCEDPDALCDKLAERDIFLIPVAGGARVSVAACPEDKARRIPKVIKELL
jgi:arginyl-tRNA synthetase